MDLGKLSAIGASERTDATKQSDNKYQKIFFADAALGKAIKKDTVCFSKQTSDNEAKRKDFINKIGVYFNEILKKRENEIAKTPEATPEVKTAESSYEAYVTDIEETNENLKPGKKPKTPVPFEEYKKLYRNAETMNDFAKNELAHFNDKYFSELTGDFESVGIKKFSSRPKGVDSIQAKLVKKFSDNQIKNASSYEECMSALGDLEGGRLTIKNLSPKFAAEVLNKYGIKEEEYAEFMLGEKDTIGILNKEDSEIAANNISNDLKELHTQNIVDRITDLIRTERLSFNDEFNNYGSANSSYFSNGQIQQIADAHFEKTGKPLDVVSSINFDNENTTEVLFDKNNERSGILNVKEKEDENEKEVFSIHNNKNNEVALIKKDKAIKKSGYSATQFNMLCKGKDGTEYGSELQIRGEAVNIYAEGEHVVYDILSGKTKTNDKKHGSECRLINSLDDKSKAELNNCLQYVYTHGRLEEFGISTKPLNFQKFNFTGSDGSDKSEEIRNMLNNIFTTAKENDWEDTIRFKKQNLSVLNKK